MSTSPQRKHLLTLLSSLVIAAVSLPAADAADEGAQLYQDKCSGCHTIGGGAMVGPDLLASTKWSESDLSAAVKRMEKNAGPMTAAEVASLVTLLRDEKVQERLKTQTAEVSKNKVETVEEPASGAEGEALFLGRRAFKNGGMACVACHAVGGDGGKLAPDLTSISDKMPEAALASACQNTSFRLMKPAYADHAVTRQEALHLSRFLTEAKGRPAGKNKKSVQALQYGGAFAGLIMLLIGLGYRNRNTGVRAKLSRRK